MLALRQAQDPEVVEEKSRRIIERLEQDPRYRQAERVLFYASFGREVATHGAIRRALAAGKVVALPVIEGDRLRPALLKDFDRDLSPNPWGILEPKNNPTPYFSPGDFPLAVVPGVAFDYEHYRLGYGKGYYDRLLSQMPRAFKIGLAYELQLVERLPRTADDVGVNFIITEERKLSSEK